jgi:glycosyltransferase involved in cell wall biosynthesis
MPAFTKEAPLFSVVIPTRDRVPLLRRAIASVRRQSLKPIELVVVDDGDGEGAAAASGQSGFGPVSVLRTGGAGQVRARNLGIAAARGRRIAFLDDDDWWEDEHHLAALDHALRGPGLAYASGHVVREDAEPPERLPYAAHADHRSIRRDNMLLVSGIAYDRSLHDRLGGFDEALPYYWDWDWYLRLFHAGVAFVEAATCGVCISVRGGTVSSAENERQRRLNLDRLADKHGLGAIALKNHESIAVEQAGDGSAPRDGATSR